MMPAAKTNSLTTNKTTVAVETSTAAINNTAVAPAVTSVINSTAVAPAVASVTVVCKSGLRQTLPISALSSSRLYSGLYSSQQPHIAELRFPQEYEDVAKQYLDFLAGNRMTPAQYKKLTEAANQINQTNQTNQSEVSQAELQQQYGQRTAELASTHQMRCQQLKERYEAELAQLTVNFEASQLDLKQEFIGKGWQSDIVSATVNEVVADNKIVSHQLPLTIDKVKLASYSLTDMTQSWLLADVMGDVDYKTYLAAIMTADWNCYKSIFDSSKLSFEYKLDLVKHIPYSYITSANLTVGKSSFKFAQEWMADNLNRRHSLIVDDKVVNVTYAGYTTRQPDASMLTTLEEHHDNITVLMRAWVNEGTSGGSSGGSSGSGNGDGSAIILYDRQWLAVTTDNHAISYQPVIINSNNGNNNNKKLGLPHGVWRTWHPNGVLASKTTWQQAAKITEQTWWPSARIKCEKNYRNGLLTGIVSCYYDAEDSPLESEIAYEGGDKDCHRNGVFHKWFKDGRRAATGSYEDGHRVGMWCEWYEDSSRAHNTNGIAFSADYGSGGNDDSPQTVFYRDGREVFEY